MRAKVKIKELFGRQSDEDDPLDGNKRYTKIRILERGSSGVVLLAVDNETREKVSTASELLDHCALRKFLYYW